MLTKTIILNTFLFCAYLAFVSGQVTLSPTNRPKPTPGAQACITALGTAPSLLDKCHNSSLSTWDPLNRGQQQGSLRELCCTIYGEIDCLKNATANSGRCNATTQPAMNTHQQATLKWIQQSSCSTIKYHTGMCDPTQYNYLPAPQPPQVANCFKKIYKQVNQCEAKPKKDWKVTPTSSPFSQSVCCSRYETNDCYINASQDPCNETEIVAFHQYYHSLNLNISKINCTDNQYQSFNCFNPNSAFPPPIPPAALNCTGKIPNFSSCSDKAGKKWHDSIKVLKGKNACCGNWDMFDCLLGQAEDSCTLPELSEFEQYYNFIAQTIVKVNCSDFAYHAKACKSAPSNSNTLQINWFLSAITLFMVSIFLKN